MNAKRKGFWTTVTCPYLGDGRVDTSKAVVKIEYDGETVIEGEVDSQEGVDGLQRKAYELIRSRQGVTA